MQDFQILDFISAKFGMGYPCVRPYNTFCFIIMVQLFYFVNITKLLKFKIAGKQPFCNCLLLKVNQVIG